MCLDHQEFVYCDPYCLPYAVETSPALSKESQEVVKIASELLDKTEKTSLFYVL